MEPSEKVEICMVKYSYELASANVVAEGTQAHTLHVSLDRNQKNPSETQKAITAMLGPIE